MRQGRRVAQAAVLIGLVVTLAGAYLSTPGLRLAWQGLIFALGLLWYVAAGEERQGLACAFRLIGLPAVVLVAVLFLSTLGSTEMAVSLNETFQAVAYLFLLSLTASVAPVGGGAYGAAEGRSSGDEAPNGSERWLDLLLLVGLLAMLGGAYLFWGGSPDMHGIFGNKNHFAGYLLLLLPLSLMAWLYAAGSLQRLIYGTAASLFLAGLILSQSRGAWLAFLPGLILLLWWERRQGRRLLRRWGLACALALLLAALAGQVVLPGVVVAGAIRDVAAITVGQEPPGTLGPRLDYWRGALGIAGDHLLLGTGPGTFANIFPAYQRHPANYSKYAHNILLQTLAEAGLPGLLSLLYLLAAFAHIIARGLGHFRPSSNGALLTATMAPGRERYLLVRGLSAGLVASFAHNLVELDWYVPAIATLAAIQGGLLLGIAVSDQRQIIRGPWARNPIPAIWAAVCLLGLIWACLRGLEYHYLTLGKEAKMKGDYQAAVNSFQIAARLGPLSAAPQKALAEVGLFAPMPGWDRAAGLAAAQQAVNLARYDPEARYLLARHYRLRNAAGDLERAIQELVVAASFRHPVQAPYVFAELGRSYLATGRRAEAWALYYRVLDSYNQVALDAEDKRFLSEVHVLLGNMAAEEGDLPQSKREYGLALTLWPENAAALFNLGVLFAAAEDWPAARNALEKAVSLAPDEALFRYQLGLIYAHIGDGEAARREWEEALRLNPECLVCQKELDRLKKQ